MAASIIPIYTSQGQVGAVIAYPHVFNLSGEWIGWLSRERQVYTVNGRHVGWLSEDWRILRKRSYSGEDAPVSPPPAPPHLRLPAHFPLAPMLAELPFHIMDVLEEQPELLPPLDLGERHTSWD
jgi:hypothetical protein